MALDLPVYVLLIGQVRNPKYLPLTLHTLEKAKSAGLITDYIISTWIGEIDQYTGMRNVVDSMSGLLVETTENKSLHQIDILPYNKTFLNRGGWFLVPMVYNALQHTPEECFVYFTRLDLAFLTSDDFIRQMESIHQMDFDHNDPECPLKKKIWVGGFHEWVPFWHHDRNVFGHRHDIEQIYHSSTYHDTVVHGHGCFPEIRYFSNAWIRKNPIIRDLLRFDWYRMIQYPQDVLNPVWGELYSHYCFSIMRASYYEILRKYYYGFVQFCLDEDHYAKLDPVPQTYYLPNQQPHNRTSLSKNEVDDERFQEALRIVQETPVWEIFQSERYQNSFADLERSIRSFGQTVLPMVRVKRGLGTFSYESSAATQLDKKTLPLASNQHSSIQIYGPKIVNPQEKFEIDVIVSVDDGYQIPATFKGVGAALSHYWRRKGEQIKFGWEHGRISIRDNIIGVMVERMEIWSPCNPGEYELLVDIIFDGHFWMQAAVPMDIIVR